MRIRRLNHSVYQVVYHIVWGTKYRRKILKQYVRKELVQSLYRVQRREPSWYIHQVNTDEDHVHLLIEFPPKYSVAKVVQELKIQSSKDIKKKFGFIRRIYERRGMWGTGYFVSTVGLNETQIRRYVARQSEYDQGEDVATEYSHE